MYAVIHIQGHQYIVQKGAEIIVDKMADVEEGKDVTFDKVLCTFDEDGKTVKVGKPFVSGATVKAKVVEHKKGPKTKVLKFQSKKRYQKKFGFRPHQTVLSIDSISG